MKFKQSDETRTLREFLTTLPPGAVVSYAAIAEQTGVAMDNKGRGRLRSALRYEGIEYDVEPNVGIVLASPENACNIVGGKLNRVEKAIKSAHRSQTNIQNKFLTQLSEHDRNNILRVGACFAAMIETGRQMRKSISSKEAPRQTLAFVPKV